MTHSVIRPGEGLHYDWTKDHIVVKTTLSLTDGRVTVVEDTLKPGFHLPRHHHKRTVEIFYVLDGEFTLVFDDETVIDARHLVPLSTAAGVGSARLGLSRARPRSRPGLASARRRSPVP